jgi:hypothetical protein
MLKAFLVFILFLIPYTYQVFNIDDYGAVANDASFEVAIKNGQAFNLALIAANSSSFSSKSDRVVLIQGNSDRVYYMLPAGDVSRLINLTIQLDGKLILWDNDHTRYPVDKNGNTLNFISLSNSENLTIQGNGIIEGRTLMGIIFFKASVLSLF